MDARAVRSTRTWLIVLGVAVALTRFLAAAHSLWEWDEALFCLGLRDFNVAVHHPHPPGFPLYIVLGHLFRIFTGDDFRALQAINLLSGMLVFPATYMLAREMKLEVVPSISAALLTSFAPNIWFYGGTAFSDVPTLAFLLFGAALLLRSGQRTADSGQQSDGLSRCPLSAVRCPLSYYAGCAIMAAACVMRPQNVLLGAYPFLAASWPRWKERKRDPILGALLIVVIVAVFFGGAAYVTGFEAYRDVMKGHSQYVLAIDSYHNPTRPPWHKVYRHFLLDPYGAGKVSTVISIFAAIGLLRFRRVALESLAIFMPFVLFSLFMLNPWSGGRYAITSMPMLMILCAEGVRVVARKPVIQAVVAAAIVGRLVQWTLPALNDVRRNDAPTFAAMQWVRQHVDRTKSTLYISEMDPMGEYLLGDYKRIAAFSDDFSGFSASDANAWLIAERTSGMPGAINFLRPRGHLFNISRKRYFEVSVRPLASVIRYGDGWYGEENNEAEVWRWMGRRSVAQLEAVPGMGELRIAFDVPVRKTVATISFNGQVIERIVCDGHVARRWVLPSNVAAPNTLTIELDRALNTPNDPRDLGLQLRACSWRAVEGK